MSAHPIFLVMIILATSFCRPQPGKGQSGIDSGSEGERTVVCFVYHRFGDSRFPSTNVTLENFRAHLSFLKENNYQVLTFEEAIDFVDSGDKDRKTAVITIDDAYKSFYENGLPVLTEFGFPATLFVNTESVGGGDYMTWEMLERTAQAGIEIGNHSHTHPYFLNLAAAERYAAFRQELDKAQNLIEKNLGFRPTTFAYPYGEFDPKMREIVKEMGFKAAAAQYSGVMHEKTDLMVCPRFPMSEYYADPDKFAEKAQMRPLRILEEKPKSFVLPAGETTPELLLRFAGKNLSLPQLQCFIQGSECTKIVEQDDKGNVTVKIQAGTSIADRRRTLYTVTVPDQQGNWHWFSHLWINPD